MWKEIKYGQKLINYLFNILWVVQQSITWTIKQIIS